MPGRRRAIRIRGQGVQVATTHRQPPRPDIRGRKAAVWRRAGHRGICRRERWTSDARGMAENGSSPGKVGRSIGPGRLSGTPEAAPGAVTVATGLVLRPPTPVRAVGTPRTVLDARRSSVSQAMNSGEAAMAMSMRRRDGLIRLEIHTMKRTIQLQGPRARNFDYNSSLRHGELVVAGPHLAPGSQRPRSDAVRQTNESGRGCRG